MKKNFLTLIALFVSGLVLTGCMSSPAAYSGKIADDAAEVVDGTGSDSSSATGSAADSGSVTLSVADSGANDERQAESLLQERNVYFDYDQSVIRTSDYAILDAHADFMLRNSDKVAILGGHTDDRGSNEYNLGLGQRRAEAVKNYLLSAGVAAGQLESISFGEEYPAVPSDGTEAAWQQNRRVNIRYLDE